jgi:hypothetical protein
MVLAAIATAVIYAVLQSGPVILIVTAAANLAVALWLFRILPEFRGGKPGDARLGKIRSQSVR